MNKGTKFILLSTLCFFVAKILIKLTPNVPVYEIVLFRAVFSFAVCSYFISKKDIPFFGTHHKDLFFRGFFGSIGLLAFFYALQTTPLATATTLINLHPIFTIVFAIWILKEKPALKQWAFFGLAFLGILLLKAGSIDLKPADFFIGSCAAVFAGLAYNFIRKLKGKEDPQTIILYLSLVAIPVLLPLSIWTWETPNAFEWCLILALCIATQCAQYFMTRAHQAAQASHIVHFSYLGVIAAVIAGWVLFDEPLTPTALTGISVIAFSVIMVNRFKHT